MFAAFECKCPWDTHTFSPGLTNAFQIKPQYVCVGKLASYFLEFFIQKSSCDGVGRD